jgi:hypothetical protein
MCISSHASNVKRQVTVKLSDQARIVGRQYGACFMSTFWPVEFEGDFYFFWKYVGPGHDTFLLYFLPSEEYAYYVTCVLYVFACVPV